MAEHPEVVEETKAAYAKKPAKKDTHELFSIPFKHSGRNLPDPKLACKFCKFIARSERGLRIHLKRSHK